MASPNAKYSKSASSVINAVAKATMAVEPHNTRPTTTGTSTAAVTTRFQVMKVESPENVQASSHHNERKKSRCVNERVTGAASRKGRFSSSWIFIECAELRRQANPLQQKQRQTR